MSTTNTTRLDQVRTGVLNAEGDAAPILARLDDLRAAVAGVLARSTRTMSGCAG